MKDMVYTRKNNVIRDYSGEKPTSEALKSCNAAKRKSRDIQMSTDGALGRGTVRLTS